MQGELKINIGGDKNVLMVIERAGSNTATYNTANTQQGEHTSTLFISFFTANFFLIVTARPQVRFIWTNSEQQGPAKFW